MMKIGQFVALAALATLVASCIGADDGTDTQALSSGRSTLAMCHNIARTIRGRGASIWKVQGVDNLLAVDVDDEIVCVDTVDETLDLGLIAIPPIGEPLTADGMVFDGTPIPAEKFNAAVREHVGRGRSSVYF